MATIIIQYYAPGWFQIKSNYLAINRAQNFWYLAQLIKNAVIDAKYKEVMEQVLKQNSYFANATIQSLLELQPFKGYLNPEIIGNAIDILNFLQH